MRKILRKQLLIPSLLFFSQADVFGQNLQARDTAKKVIILTKNIRFYDLKESIRRQTGWLLVYSNREIDSRRTFNFKETEVSVGQIINQVADTFRVFYSVANNAIVFKPKPKGLPYQGTVVSAKDQAMKGVVVLDLSSGISVKSNKNGRFDFGYTIRGKWLLFTYKNYHTQRYQPANNDTFRVIMKPAWKEDLLTVEVTASKNASSRNGIFRQSVTMGALQFGVNDKPATQLQNKVPGVLIMNSNGASGSPAKLKMRGRTTIGLNTGLANLPENNTLFLVDSSIWSGPNGINYRLPSMAGSTGNRAGTNPLEVINPADIENIEFYMNADATPRYGSLASNNIVSILTKQGRPGEKLEFNFNGTTGVAEAATRIRLMNTQQYFAARREALLNDGLPIDKNTAPDLFFWPESRSTDWYKYLVDNTADLLQVHGSLKGQAGKKTGLYAGAGYKRETTVLALKRISKNYTFHLNANHCFSKSSFVQASFSMNAADYQLPAFNPIPLSFMAPNAPEPDTRKKDTVPSENGLDTFNIKSILENSYEASQLVMRGSLKYEQKIVKGLSFVSRLSVNRSVLNEENRFPKRASQTMSTGMTATAHSKNSTLVLENELNYLDTSNKQRIINIQVGSTVLQESNACNTVMYQGYTNDDLLGVLSEAASIISEKNQNSYHYIGITGAFNIQWQKKYILNVTIRQNNSSRFSARNQSGYSGAVGGSLSFTKIKWLAEKLKFLDNGKLHASAGLVLSDHVETNRNQTNYSFVTDGSQYNNILPLMISQLANPALTWEKSFKKDIGIELWFKNCIFFNATWYRILTTNQFISAVYPRFTGIQLQRIINHDAAVLNTGLELAIGINRSSGDGQRAFSSKLSATTHKNRVERFPGLENSLYKNTIRLKSSITSQPVLMSNGVDPATGKYTFIDMNGDGKISRPEDLVPGPDLDPLLFGGWQNKFRVRCWEFEVFIDGMIQKALNPKLATMQHLPGSFHPDMLSNLYVSYNNHWSKAGDNAPNQKMSASGTGGTQQSFSNHLSSDEMLVDGSFARLRFVSIGYTFPREWSNAIHLKQATIYLRAQNLLLLTRYRDGDPTQLDPFAIPSSRSLSAGLSISF